MSAIENLIDKLSSATVNEESVDSEVSFAGKGLKLDTGEDAEEIVTAIQNCPFMTTLRLEGNTMGIPAAQAIAKALENKPEFKRALWRDMFTRRTEHEIPQALGFLSSAMMQANASLVELDLSDNAFGPRGLKGIVALLESPTCYNLEELRLNNNGLGITGCKMLAEALNNCLANSRRDNKPMNLKVFVCGRNRLENEGATAISKFLKNVGTLQSIAMPQNGIYHPGIKQLSEALASNPDLKNLNLEDNSLTAEGAKHIADCLPKLTNLEMIHFGDCLLRTKGALELAKALKSSCPELREIHLGFNEMNLDGGRAIVEALRDKAHLENLGLNGNQFGDEGCDELKHIMSEANKSDILGTLSDDEGVDDGEDEEGDVENDEDDSAELDDSKNDEEDSNEHRSPLLKTTPEDFINDPSSEKLITLKKSNADFISMFNEEATAMDYFDAFIKISSVIKMQDEVAKAAACEFSDELLGKAFKLFGESSAAAFHNDFLVCLELLKGENRNPKSIDISGALIVLEHVVRQPYFSSSLRDLLQFFLSRPLLYATACNKAKHALLQTLYRI